MRKTMKAILWSALIIAPAAAYAQGQPPIQSAQDAACRQEAASRVFSTPNPRGLDPYSLGARIWSECMGRAGRSYRRAGHVRRVHRHSRHVRRVHGRARHVRRIH
jgi:hypothetical protein